MPAQDAEAEYDAFEARLKFSTLLGNLSASVAAAQKAARYLMVNKHCGEDLFEVALEWLERDDMNLRIKIWGVWEELAEMAARDEYQEYLNSIRENIQHFIDIIVPPERPMAANIRLVRKGLDRMQKLGVFTETRSKELDEMLEQRTKSMQNPDLDPAEAAHNQDLKEEPHDAKYRWPNAFGDIRASGQKRPADKKQIEQRIEEDRERHKRLKESIWQVGNGENEESDKMWEECSDIDEGDLMAAEDETSEMLGISVEALRTRFTAPETSIGV